MKLRSTVRENGLPLGLAGGAMAACCTIHLIILAGGIGAAASIPDDWPRPTDLIIAGLGLFIIGVAVVVIKRSKPSDDTSCCPPS